MCLYHNKSNTGIKMELDLQSIAAAAAVLVFVYTRHDYNLLRSFMTGSTGQCISLNTPPTIYYTPRLSLACIFMRAAV